MHMQATQTHGFVSGQASSSISRRAVITGAGAAIAAGATAGIIAQAKDAARSEEHTSELQSLRRISYAVFCLKKKIK